MLLSEEIQFLSYDFPFFATTKISRATFRFLFNYYITISLTTLESYRFTIRDLQISFEMAYVSVTLDQKGIDW